MPSSATPRPSEVRIRYFQPASSARGLAAEADEQRRGRGRRLDEQPGGAEVAGQRHREQHRPEGVERRRSTSRSRRRSGDERAAHASPGRRARRARWRGRRAPMTPTSSPPAASTTIQLPTTGVPGRPSATAASATASAAGRDAPASATRVASRARRDGDEPPRSAPAAATTAPGEQLAASHAGSSARRCRRRRTRRRSARGRRAATSATSVRSSATPSSITSDEPPR